MLLQMSLLDQVDALVSQSGQTAQISYESDTWYRTDPVLMQLAGVLGMSESQLTELFYQASKI
jgi:AraC-like DNA-binding protein